VCLGRVRGPAPRLLTMIDNDEAREAPRLLAAFVVVGEGGAAAK
jgi:hypothetical protein